MIQETLKTFFPAMVERRRYLHRYPELSFQEQKTSAYVADELRKLGLDIVTGVGGNGVIGTIKGQLPGKTVALRADMDALPIQDEKACEYASQVPGVMHACGHDGHTSVLLAVAEYFSVRKETLKGEIRLLFQPAEEVCPGGALSMIKDGALNGVDVIYGVHLWTPIPVGTTASRPGAFMASTDEFFIELTGRGGHGGMPHTAVDSVVAGAALVLQLQSVVSRSVNPLDPAVLTVGSIRGGTAQNVIADTCRLAGTVRCFHEETRKTIRERIEQLAHGTAQAYGAGAFIDYMAGYPSLVNHREEFERFQHIAATEVGLTVEHSPQIMPAEDFAYYLQQVPGCFMLVGAGNPEKNAVYPHHHPKFDFDEEAMLHAASLLIAMTQAFQSDRQ
ncbi:M20 family metallopeptidase [Paenibacillus lentus]|uniref:Amidohydrolase n=1 Tax=Paenibacillus lentus TaxID=1338368 RepID=A0A3Q8SBS2_9BACL|nr:M20 family metallopeptidase [Paenibacillus lentus]AZK46973.1 amidohydrolase [Paenibacillus lentus]